MEGAKKKVCGVCNETEGRYQCPRCNILYCSTDCYRNPSHSKCSEAFYEECVKNEMRSMGPNDHESQKKMYEILQRVNKTLDESGSEEELDSDDDEVDEDDVDLAERLKNVNLEKADEVWQKLTESEKRQFEELVKSNDITEILPEFEPWWIYKDERKVVELDKASPFEETHKQKCPAVNSKTILPFCKLSKTPPAPTVCYNLTNVLTAYVFTVRYFNGDHHDCFNESTVSIVTLSKNLSNNENYFDFVSAVKSVFMEVTNNDFLKGYSDMNCIVDIDVRKIFEGPDNNPSNKTFYVLSALSDMHKLFSKAVKSYQPNSESSTSKDSSNGEFSKRFPESGISSLPDVPKLKIKNCLKKIEYYLSWSVEYFNSVNF